MLFVSLSANDNVLPSTLIQADVKADLTGPDGLRMLFRFRLQSTFVAILQFYLTLESLLDIGSFLLFGSPLML
jgi:hypothetical protein